MASAVTKPVAVEDQVRHFSVSSRWIVTDDCRFDATTYAQEAYESIRILERSGHTIQPLKSFVGKVYHPTENQPRSNFKRRWVKKGEGPPFLTGKQLFYFRPDREKYISERMPKIHELRMPVGSLLVSRSGTTGFPVYVSQWLSEFAVTDDAIRVFPDQHPIGFIYAYLASSIGRPLLTKNEYGSTVSHLEAKHVTTVPVPVLGEQKEKEIDAAIRRAYSKRDEGNYLLDQADELLHKSLGLTPFSEEDIEYLGEKGDPRTFRVISRELYTRFDATNHVPIVRSVVHKLKTGRFSVVRLDKLCNRICIPPRFKRNYAEVEDGVPYLMPSQLVAMRRYGMKAISQKQASESPEYLLKRGELLLSTDGTVGRVHPVTDQMVGWFGSNNIARLSDPTANIWFLYAFLSTPFGLHQIRKEIYGGVVDHISEHHIGSVLCPDVPGPVQKEIGAMVEHAFRLKGEAENIEDRAVAALEAAIRG